MANFVQINAAGTAVLYEPDGKTQVSAVGLVVLYSLQPDVTGVQANAVGLVTLYSDIPPGHRVFPIPPSQRSLQSQIGKRKFPIVQ